MSTGDDAEHLDVLVLHQQLRGSLEQGLISERASR